MKNQSIQHTPAFSHSLPALLLLTGVFFANFLARTLFGPLLLPIGSFLHLSISQSGSLFVCLSAGYSCSVLCAGFLSMHIGHKRTIVLSLSTISAGLFGISLSTSFEPFLLSTFLTGLGAGLYMPSGVVTITEITPSAHWGTAFSVHELAPNLAFILAPFIAEVFLNSVGFSTLFGLFGGICSVLSVIYALYGPKTLRPGVPPILGNIRAIISRPAFWIMLILFVLAVGVEVGVYNLVPAFLVHDHGLTREKANFILGCSRVLSLLVLPWTGWAVRRIGYHKTLIWCMIGTALSTIGSSFGPLWWTLAMLVLQPVFVVCFFPVGFAVLSTVCPKSTSDLSVSLTVMSTSILGAGLMPAGLAWCGEHFSFAGSFALFGGAILGVSVWALRQLKIPAA